MAGQPFGRQLTGLRRSDAPAGQTVPVTFTPGRPWLVLLALGLALVPLSACGGDDEPAEAAPSNPSDVAVPDGVELSEPGTDVQVGNAATAVYVAGDRESVVTLKVTDIRRGSQQDFAGYQLDPRAARSVPWYVDSVMTDVGEGRLGTSPVPLYGYDSDHTYFPAAQVQGGFRPCRPAQLSRDFGPGDSVRGCLVYFVPRDVDLVSVQLRGDEGVEPISWPVPG